MSWNGLEWHEIIGALGIGWNFRLDSFSRNLKHPAVAAMAPKYGYNDTDVAVANERIIQILNALAGQLRTQQAAGSEYFIGQTATAVDFYWTAVSWLLDMPPRARIPYHPDMAQWFGTRDQAVVDAIDPIRLKHRDRMLSQFFKNPLEF